MVTLGSHHGPNRHSQMLNIWVNKGMKGLMSREGSWGLVETQAQTDFGGGERVSEGGEQAGDFGPL